MTIAVSVKVGEGLVMAADSMSSYFDNGVLAQSYHHARKLLQLSESPIGILTYGLGDVGGRNLESLLAEFEQTISTYAEAGSYTMRGIAEQLHGFIRGHAQAPESSQTNTESSSAAWFAGGWGVVTLI